MKQLDDFLNRITMYRLVVYVLFAEAGAGFLLSVLGMIAPEPSHFVASGVILLSFCFITEHMLAKIWRSPYNHESWLVSALILFLILRPPQNLRDIIVTAMAGVIAIASKYIIAWRGRHLFNPAAFAAAFMSLSALQTTSWWVGNSKLWPLTLILGLAVVRKIRRFPLFFTFIAVSLAAQLALVAHSGQPLGGVMKSATIASPLIFLSTIMLTEPATMPPRSNQQIIFAALVGILYVEAWKIGPLYIYPEVALLLGNIFAFVIAPKLKAVLRLKEIQKISNQVYNFVFEPDQKFNFKPGQYMEWTLPNVPFDSRGNRRTFTIASSPTENTLQLGVKFYNPSSAYKYTLGQLKPGDPIYASQVAGSFTLDANQEKKLAFIAGGIGVTPFRSMIKFLTDKRFQTDITLIYLVGSVEELAYKKELADARAFGIKTLPIVNKRLTPQLVAEATPDFAERIFYVSGPNAMVESAKKMLQGMGVRKIKTDHFSGY